MVPQELSRRCETLIRLIEKENEEDEERGAVAKKRGPKPKTGGDSQAPSGGSPPHRAPCSLLPAALVACATTSGRTRHCPPLPHGKTCCPPPPTPPVAESGRGKRKADSSGMPSAKRSKEVGT